MQSKSIIRKAASFVLMAFCITTVMACNANSALAAKKKSSGRKSKPTAVFDLNRFIEAHRSDDRNTIHEQLVALKGDFKRTYSLGDGEISNVTLLMLACLFVADVNSLDAIGTLLDNNPELLNVRDSLGQTAIFYALQNEFNCVRPFEILLSYPNIQVNIASNSGVTPIQMLVRYWGRAYGDETNAINEMVKKGANLIYEGGGMPSAIQIMIDNQDPNAQIFLPVAQRQYQNSQGRR